jgi:hypothetical protein
MGVSLAAAKHISEQDRVVLKLSALGYFRHTTKIPGISGQLHVLRHKIHGNFAQNVKKGTVICIGMGYTVRAVPR